VVIAVIDATLSVTARIVQQMYPIVVEIDVGMSVETRLIYEE
jgi:hypothetical protein